MANRHFGKAADVWKHVVLGELLGLEQPLRYGETHAGSAAYPMVEDDERQFGASNFLRLADAEPVLGNTRYAVNLRKLMAPTGAPATYPGSPLLAMLERRSAAEYILCDLDGTSTKDLERWRDELALSQHVHIVLGDGMTIIGERFLGRGHRPGFLVHVDPFDPHAKTAHGRSAIELAGALVRAGVGLSYWYGYDAPQQRGWPLTHLSGNNRRRVWCGDMLVVDDRGGTRPGGALGVATTPGTGFGVVVANVSSEAIERCAVVGEALAAGYRDSKLPDGTVGGLNFQQRSSAVRGSAARHPPTPDNG